MQKNTTNEISIQQKYLPTTLSLYLLLINLKQYGKELAAACRLGSGEEVQQSQEVKKPSGDKREESQQKTKETHQKSISESKEGQS